MVDHDGVLRWDPPEPPTPLHYDNPTSCLAHLRKRRKHMNPLPIEHGIEFDSYPPDCAPAPDLRTARTRVRFYESLIGAHRG